MKLDLLLQPGRIGGLEVPNRLVMAPIAMRAADPKGFLTPALADFYELRARGGAGLIIMGHTFCWPEEKTGGNTGLWSDDHIAPLADLASRVHAHGSKLGIQLGGRGTRRADGRSMAPTAMRFGFEDGVAREITVEEIEYWVENYGLAARRAREAGMDCVEIHAAHGKLVSLFLSPYSNRRTDEYGGSLEKRCRFPMDIVRSIRRHAGDDFPIIFRFSAEDMLEGGNTQEDGIAIAKVMTEAGVDAFEVSAGNQERGWNTSFSYFFPRACLRHLPGPIREATGKPVLALAKINDVFMGEKLLQEGIADFISMGRPFVTDPWLLKKAIEGRTDEIRRCIYCLNCFTYGDRKHRMDVRGITCTVNPELLREREFAELKPAETKKRVMVIGGGLAGMQAAAVLGQRGHEVDLYEASSELGGQWLVAAHAGHKADFRTLIPYLKNEMKKGNVRVHLDTRVDEALLQQEKPEAVVLATGARPRELPLPRPENGGPAFVQAMDVIMDRAETGQRVVVVGGRYIGMEAAAKLAGQGKHVSLVEAMELGHGTLARLKGIYRNMLVENDVHIFDRSPVLRVVSNGVDVAHTGSMLTLPCDTVVTAIGTVPNEELKAALEALGVEWHAIGDCDYIGDALFSVREGAEIGRKI